MAVLNTLAPIHTVNRVNNTTSTSPTMGCQIGMLTGVDILTIIIVGVNGGMNDNVVARLPIGFCITGTITKRGIMMGNIAGN